MPLMVEREKWILYKHTCKYDLIKAVALDVKNSCLSQLSTKEKYLMQERLASLDLYKTRNPKERPLDAINHRINTLEFYMFGYESKDAGERRFIFSPLGNLFLKYIKDEEKLKRIFLTMLFGIQFQHWANGTPKCFHIYPFRLLFKLMSDKRLGGKLYSTEYAYIVAFTKDISLASYELLVAEILEFRNKPDSEKIKLLKEDEHTYVNCIYEWQYYTQTLLEQAGILTVYKGEKMCQLFHPRKTNSMSAPTGRWVMSGFSEISSDIYLYVQRLLENYSFDSVPLSLDATDVMQMDVVKEIYSFYPSILLEEIGEEVDSIQARLLSLPTLIERYSKNPDNECSSDFENVLVEGFEMFYNLEVHKISGPGHTDIECLYIKKSKKFAVEAKSTSNKLSAINAGRLKNHRHEIGGVYTIVITPRYVPAAARDIEDEPIVIVLARTFSEYLYNNIYHGVREIDYGEFDDIIEEHLGTDVSKLISKMTMEKFASKT